MMERSAKAPAPFSLHCTICFDEFNLTDKAPVILPCGHTYLCEPCSKRLRSCMECRSPLFVAFPKPSGGMSPSSSRHSQPRHSPSVSPRSADGSTKSKQPASNISPQRQDLFQLPIPKNLVLIALLEAAQQTVKAEKRQDEGYESGDDDGQVLDGMNLLSSAFGTYVVREKNGLVVQPLSPTASSYEDESKVQASPLLVNTRPFTERNDADVESFDLQDPVGVQALQSSTSSLEAPSFDKNNAVERAVFRQHETAEEQDKKPFMLRYGQTVQIVSYQDGVATLARRNGYIEASDGQLVKVGDAVDHACKIEGMLSNVANKKKALRSKLEELEFVEGELSQKLDEALLKPDPDPFATAPGFEDALASLSSSTPDSLSLNKSSGNSDQQVQTFPDLTSGRTESAEFDNFVLSVTAAPREDGRIARSLPTRQILSPEPAQSLPYFGCTANILPGLLSDDDGANTSPLYDVRRPRSSSRFHGIDFRTGLSGHMALTSASAHVEHGIHRRHIRMMGEHRGIGNIRRIRPSGSSDSLSNPTW